MILSHVVTFNLKKGHFYVPVIADGELTFTELKRPTFENLPVYRVIGQNPLKLERIAAL